MVNFAYIPLGTVGFGLIPLPHGVQLITDPQMVKAELRCTYVSKTWCGLEIPLFPLIGEILNVGACW